MVTQPPVPILAPTEYASSTTVHPTPPSGYHPPQQQQNPPLQHTITQRGGYYPPTPLSMPFSEDTHQSFTPPILQPPVTNLVQTQLPFRNQQQTYAKPPDFPKFKDKTTEYNHWKVRCQLTLAQTRDPLFNTIMVTRNVTGLEFNSTMIPSQQGALFLLTSSALSETFSQSIISTTQLLQANGIKLWQKLDDHFVEQEGNSVVLTLGLQEAFNTMTQASNESIFNFTHRFEKAYSKCVYHKLSMPASAELTCQFIKALKMPSVFAVIITNLDKSDYADYLNSDIEELGKKLKKFYEINTAATGIDPYPLTAVPPPTTTPPVSTPTPTTVVPINPTPVPTPTGNPGRGRATNPVRQPSPAVVANMAEIKSRLIASTTMVSTIRDTHFQCVNGNRCFIHQLNSDHDFLKCYKLKAVCKEIDESTSNNNAMTALTHAIALVDSSRGGQSPAPVIAPPTPVPVVSAAPVVAPVAAPVAMVPPPGMIQQQQYAPPAYAQQNQYPPQYQYAPRQAYYPPRQRVQNPYIRARPPSNQPVQPPGATARRVTEEEMDGLPDEPILFQAQHPMDMAQQQMEYDYNNVDPNLNFQGQPYLKFSPPPHKPLYISYRKQIHQYISKIVPGTTYKQVCTVILATPAINTKSLKTYYRCTTNWGANTCPNTHAKQSTHPSVIANNNSPIRSTYCSGNTVSTILPCSNISRFYTSPNNNNCTSQTTSTYANPNTRSKNNT